MSLALLFKTSLSLVYRKVLHSDLFLAAYPLTGLFNDTTHSCIAPIFKI